MIEKIVSFTREYSFLSNDHTCLVHYDGLLFSSVTHAFQAARSADQEIKERISKIEDIESMYKIAETIEDPPRWVKDRKKIMEVLIRDKFRRNPVLRQRLQETNNKLLINSYVSAENPNNLFWGTVDERGENIIGKILMKIRADLISDTELDKWLLLTFDLITEVSDIPRIVLHEFRSHRKLRKICLENKPYYTIGSGIDCDLKFSHNSIDTYHAVLLHDKQLGLVLIDLNSTTGTFIKDSRIKKCIPAPLEENEEILFGEKKKTFFLEIDYERVRKECEKKIEDVDEELKMLEMMQNPSRNIEVVKEKLGVIGSKRIFVDNIVRRARNEKDLKELFASIGEITEVYVPRRGSNEAYINFSKFEMANAAVKWNGMMFHGRRLEIRIDKTRKRSRSRSFSSSSS